MQVGCFWSFAAQTRKVYTGHDQIVDVCLHAMEEGRLPVIVKQCRYYLWEYYILTVDQWVRICALLQQNRFSPCLLWRLQITYVRWVRRTAFVGVAVLTGIEFLWQDLDAVQAYVDHLSPAARYDHVEWIVAELDRRRQWFTGLRRTWLLAASDQAGDF